MAPGATLSLPKGRVHEGAVSRGVLVEERPGDEWLDDGREDSCEELGFDFSDEPEELFCDSTRSRARPKRPPLAESPAKAGRGPPTTKQATTKPATVPQVVKQRR